MTLRHLYDTVMSKLLYYINSVPLNSEVRAEAEHEVGAGGARGVVAGCEVVAGKVDAAALRAGSGGNHVVCWLVLFQAGHQA